ncbi:MAG: response regulator, partial [Cyanobacteria bacterium J06650_10]
DGDGIDFAQRFRREGYANPLMILTAKETTAEKVRALDAGADDYVVKPFDFDELCARIRALLRRENQGLPTILSWGALQLDPSACKTTYNNNPVRLTPKEFSMMELFLRHPYRVYSLGAIIDDLWSFDDPPGEDAVRTHIKGLRRKLKAAGAPKDLIKTVYGLGYQLNENTIEQATADKSAGESQQTRLQQTKDLLKQDSSPQETLSQDDHSEQAHATSAIPVNRDELPFLESARLVDQNTGQNFAEGMLSERMLSNQQLPGRDDNGVPNSSELKRRITEACDRYLSSVNIQLTTLESFLQALSDGSLDLALGDSVLRDSVPYKDALAIAHNLSGSLGSFGFAAGSQIARELDTQLKALPALFARVHVSDATVSDATVSDATVSDEIGPLLSSETVLQLSQSVQSLRQLVKQAEVRSSADTLSDYVQAGLPVLLIVSEDDAFAQRLVAIAPQAHLKTKQVKTLAQAKQLLKVARCDLLLVDTDIGAAQPVAEISGSDESGSDESGSNESPDSPLFDRLQFIQQIKEDYLLPVMVTAPPLTLAHRLDLIKQGVDVVSDRTTEPLQITLAAAGMIQAEGQRGRVAIADDDPDMLDLFRTSLEPWGFQITAFESAPALWQWLDTPTGPQACSLPIDILVLDIEMPTFSGLELCQVIRADTRFQSIPILFLTKYQENSLRTQAYQAGGDDFIHKAIAPAELAIRLRNQLKRACRI